MPTKPSSPTAERVRSRRPYGRPLLAMLLALFPSVCALAEPPTLQLEQPVPLSAEQASLRQGPVDTRELPKLELDDPAELRRRNHHVRRLIGAGIGLMLGGIAPTVLTRRWAGGLDGHGCPDGSSGDMLASGVLGISMLASGGALIAGGLVARARIPIGKRGELGRSARDRRRTRAVIVTTTLASLVFGAVLGVANGVNCISS